jgi:Cu2+-containing amine oxidase
MRLALGLAFLILHAGAAAAQCTSGTELVQSFPSAGGDESQWKLCWRVERMPDDLGNPTASETLVVSEATFRPGGAASDAIAVLGDLRMVEIFVPYDAGSPRFLDLGEMEFELVALSAAECTGTRLDANRVCQELRDRELAWREPGAALGRRGEKLVLWSILNASNYDYVMYYAFFDDGTVEVRAGATGRKLGGPNDTAGHTHAFAWRADLDVAGPGGDSVTLEQVKYTGAAVREKPQPIASEGAFAWSPEAFTHVEVEDETSVNGRGRHRGYVLAPHREGVPKFRESWARQPLWVTRSQGPGEELRAVDLPSYANKESVAGEDVVLWYVDVHHHEENMRDEDRDAVPILWIGFHLVPQNFWDRTPFFTD